MTWPEELYDAKLGLRFDTQVSHCLVITTHPGIGERHKVNTFRMNSVPITSADLSSSLREYRFSLVWLLPKMFRNPKSNIKNESSLFKHHPHTVPAYSSDPIVYPWVNATAVSTAGKFSVCIFYEAFWWPKQQDLSEHTKIRAVSPALYGCRRVIKF